MLPQDLQMDIQQFSKSDYAKQYFSTYRSGFIFRRRVPVEQLMTWQKVSWMMPFLFDDALALIVRKPVTADIAAPDAQQVTEQGCRQNLQGHSTDHGRS